MFAILSTLRHTFENLRIWRTGRKIGLIDVDSTFLGVCGEYFHKLMERDRVDRT